METCGGRWKNNGPFGSNWNVTPPSWESWISDRVQWATYNLHRDGKKSSAIPGKSPGANPMNCPFPKRASNKNDASSVKAEPFVLTSARAGKMSCNSTKEHGNAKGWPLMRAPWNPSCVASSRKRGPSPPWLQGQMAPSLRQEGSFFSLTVRACTPLEVRSDLLSPDALPSP